MATPTGSSTPTRSVAVIGGGISGLSCAQILSSSFDVTVFDTGRLRPGGRCSSREPGDVPKEDTREYPLLSRFRIDHAAQLITVPKGEVFEEFRTQMNKWKQEGVVKECPPGSVSQIRGDGSLQTLEQKFFFGTQGMGSIPLAMTKQKGFSLEQDVWVPPSSGVKYQKASGKWKLQKSGKTLGIYDKVVIAHNGKCADRIMSKTPAKDVHGLLRVNFSPTVPAHGGKKMTLNSLYSLTMVLEKGSDLSKALPEPMISGFCGHPSLRMVTCQTRKFDDPSDAEYEVWTVLSSANFAKKYKAPQEFIPEEREVEVIDLLLKAIYETVLSKTDSKIIPLETRLQLWGAAVPLNVWKAEEGSAEEGFLYQSDYNIGVCGDWLLDPSIAGAWTSGRLLSKHMTSQEGSSGLNGSFQRNEAVSKLGVASLDV